MWEWPPSFWTQLHGREVASLWRWGWLSPCPVVRREGMAFRSIYSMLQDSFTVSCTSGLVSKRKVPWKSHALNRSNSQSISKSTIRELAVFNPSLLFSLVITRWESMSGEWLANVLCGDLRRRIGNIKHVLVNGGEEKNRSETRNVSFTCGAVSPQCFSCTSELNCEQLKGFKVGWLGWVGEQISGTGVCKTTVHSGKCRF